MKYIVMDLVAVYLLIMSVTGFAAMVIDKRRAIRKGWRISERTLLLIALLGGGIGSFLGMRAFRHKTKHVRFTVILPLAAALYTILGSGLFYLRMR